LLFTGEDGSPDLDTLYQLESVPGRAWVASAALTPPQISSDEWRICFFGSLTNAAAQDDADPDGDGMLNWQEYLAGTNPTNALSALQFLNPVSAASAQNINLNWQTAPGRSYVLQSSPAAGGNNWTPVNTNLGDGNIFQVVGTNHPGELAPLVKMIQPGYGVITSVGREHLEFFGDVAGVAQEEGWLAELLPADGKLFVDGDNEWASHTAARTRAQVVRVGFGASNEWRARGVRLEKQGVRFHVDGPKADFAGEYRMQLLGRHQVVNALFAIAIGMELGLGRADVAKGLAECIGMTQRSGQIIQETKSTGKIAFDDMCDRAPDGICSTFVSAAIQVPSKYWPRSIERVAAAMPFMTTITRQSVADGFGPQCDRGRSLDGNCVSGCNTGGSDFPR